jgi:hypothetical protein
VADLLQGRSLDPDLCTGDRYFHSHLWRNPARDTTSRTLGTPPPELFWGDKFLLFVAKRRILRITISCASNFLSCSLGRCGTHNWDFDQTLDARLRLLSLCGSISSAKWIESAKIMRSSFGGWRRVGRKYLGLA